jgi:hypothetical protein
MLPFPIPKWVYGAIALVIALASFAAYQRHEGASTAMTKVREAQAEVTQVQTAAKAKTEAKQEDVTAKVTKNYEARLAALRGSYATYRLRNPTTGAASNAYMPSVSTTSSEPDAAPRCDGLPLSVAIPALEAADENTLKLTSLQTWVAEQEQAQPKQP